MTIMQFQYHPVTEFGDEMTLWLDDQGTLWRLKRYSTGGRNELQRLDTEQRKWVVVREQA
jgi:hypothetical protein